VIKIKKIILLIIFSLSLISPTISFAAVNNVREVKLQDVRAGKMRYGSLNEVTQDKQVINLVEKIQVSNLQSRILIWFDENAKKLNLVSFSLYLLGGIIIVLAVVVPYLLFTKDSYLLKKNNLSFFQPSIVKYPKFKNYFQFITEKNLKEVYAILKDESHESIVIVFNFLNQQISQKLLELFPKARQQEIALDIGTDTEFLLGDIKSIHKKIKKKFEKHTQKN
jgi:hypothetical protein